MTESRERSEWGRLSNLMALVANAHRDPKRHSTVRPEAFNPYAGRDRYSELTRRKRAKAPLTVLRDVESGQTVFPNITTLKPEYTYGGSRVDFYLECGRQRIFIEVKGCTLEIDGIGYFPDAPTERGVKHLHELMKATKDGFECFIAFVIAMPDVIKVFPNRTTHPKFGEALDAAVKAGVRILHLPCEVKPDELAIRGDYSGF